MRGPYQLDVSEFCYKGDANQNYGIGPYFLGTTIYIPLVYTDDFNFPSFTNVAVSVSTDEVNWTTHIVHSHGSGWTNGTVACSRFGDVLYFSFLAYDPATFDVVVGIVTFDMVTLTASPIVLSSYPYLVASFARHTSPTGYAEGYVQFFSELTSYRFQCEAISANDIFIPSQVMKNETVGVRSGAAIAYSKFESGAWVPTNPTMLGHGTGQPSNLIVCDITVGANVHQFFVSGDGRLFHETIGASTQEVTSIYYPGDASIDGWCFNRTGDYVCQVVYDAASNTLMIPYRNASGGMSIAFASETPDPTWTIEVVYSGANLYDQWQPGDTAYGIVLGEYPTPMAIAVIDGEWNAFFLDNANRRFTGDVPGFGNGNLQTVYRAIRSGGTWGAPTAYYQAPVWINGVDVTADAANGRFAVLLQINAPTRINPWIIFDDAAGGIDLTAGIPSSVAMGLWSGLTGGGVAGGCSAGRDLPRGGDASRVCGSIYFAQ